MGRVTDRVRWEVKRHWWMHVDWAQGRCRLVPRRAFPFAGFEYPLPEWQTDREPEHAR